MSSDPATVPEDRHVFLYAIRIISWVIFPVVNIGSRLGLRTVQFIFGDGEYQGIIVTSGSQSNG